MGRPAETLTWDFSCPDWVERLQAQESLLPDLPLDMAEAERAVSIFNRLRLPDVPGQPTMEEAAGDWARDIIRPIFGSLIDGRRMVREVLAMVPKKNAKTTNAAGVSVTALLMNERPRAELVLVGPTQEIADTGFQQAAGMIDADEYLRTRFQVQEHRRTIVDQVTGARLKIKTFDMKVATGSKPVMVLIDELHLMGQMGDAGRVIAQLRGGMIANPEAFLVMITTQSDTPPAGVFKAELDYARGVREGRIKNGRVLPLLYEFPESMQIDPERPWRDVRNWPMVLPNLGRSISIERLAEDYEAAIEKGEEEERRWASQHLNVQIGLALHNDRWRGADHWEAAADAELAGMSSMAALDRLIERCEVLVVGVDGGGLDDLFGLCIAGREAETGHWLFWFHAWAHTCVLDLRKDIADRLRDFARDGDLTFYENGDEDVQQVADLIERVRDTGKRAEKHWIGVDPANIAALQTELSLRGFEPDEMAAIGQGYRLYGAIVGSERKLQNGTALHCGRALMNWVVGNAKAVVRGSAVVIEKQTAGRAKIDPLIAMFNAVKRLEVYPVAMGGAPASPWDDPDFKLVA